jgi:hypothetical protein
VTGISHLGVSSLVSYFIAMARRAWARGRRAQRHTSKQERHSTQERSHGPERAGSASGLGHATGPATLGLAERADGP